MIANVAPCGSHAIAKRPTPGMSFGGSGRVPPCCFTRPALASQSTTAK
jgi:hypothetical protein